jgi:hypothetical protein
MRVSEVRNWLGIYFLLVTAGMGAYLLIFGETKILPISKEDSHAAFQILIPVLIGQLTIIFKWFTGDQFLNSNRRTTLPHWVVKGPPLLAVTILIVAVIATIIGGNSGEHSMDGESFKSVITFAVALLNASTVFLVMKLFSPSSNEQDAAK